MKPKKRTIEIIKISWLLTCFGIGTLFFTTGQFSGEYAVPFIVMMSIVTFPIGYLAIYLLRAMAWFFSTIINHDLVGSFDFSIPMWILMTVFGYFQWFFLVPKIYQKIKMLKTN